MRGTSVPNMSSMAVSMIVVCGLLASGMSAEAQSPGTGPGKPCSNRTLRGDYGSAVEGVILPAPGVALPIRGVVMATYDGDGHFTQVDHIVFNGVPPRSEWTPGSGTYHVNADCTGTGQILMSSGGFVNLAFVVVRQGREIRAVVTAPFDGPARTITSVGLRVE